MYQIRIYTMATAKAAKEYFEIHWKKHLESLPKFGIKVHGIFYENETTSNTRVFALVSYEEGANIPEVNKQYMDSIEFKEDMEGFDFKNIVNVDEVTVSDPSYFPFINK